MLNSKVRIAIVVSVFNSQITDQLLQGALNTLMESGVNKNKIKILKVPGAIEIPLTAKLLAGSKKFDAIICLGAVIRGETDHYEYVCQQISQGCQQVMLEFNLPVIFGVLTTKNVKQAQARVSKLKEHNGVEAAHTALSMIKLIQTLY